MALTRQQVWSLNAHLKVKAVLSHEKEYQSKYRTHAIKLPSLLQRSGLIQALVFTASRDAEGEQLCEDIAAVYDGWSKENLIHEAQTSGLAQYMALTRSMMAVAMWFRRFAEIELKKLEAKGGDA